MTDEHVLSHYQFSGLRNETEGNGAKREDLITEIEMFQ